MATEFTKNIPVLSQVNVNQKSYYLKDAEAREKIINLIDNQLKTAAYKDVAASVAEGQDNLPTANAVKAYVDGAVGAIHNFDVVVDPTGSGAGPSVEATDKTMFKIYLVPDSTAASGSYVEWITIKTKGEIPPEGSEAPDVYTWEKIGSTKTDLTGYVPKERKVGSKSLEQDITAEDLKKDLKLAKMAEADSASADVSIPDTVTINDFTPAGKVAVTLTQTPTEIASTGSYTPAGSLKDGTTTAKGSVEVNTTVDNAAAASITKKDDYKPEGTITVTLKNATFNKITGVGKLPEFTEGEFKAATCEHTEGKAAAAGFVASVAPDTEILTLSDAGKVDVSHITSFDGGSKAKDTWKAGSLPTMEETTVGVAKEGTAFTGTTATGLIPSAITYSKTTVGKATFTGEASTVSGTLEGTPADITVKGSYNLAGVDTAETKFTAEPQAITGTISASKTTKVTVSPDAKAQA